MPKPIRKRIRSATKLPTKQILDSISKLNLIELNIPAEDKGNGAELIAYAFDSNGVFISQSPIVAGVSKLGVGATIPGTRVLIAGKIPSTRADHTPTIEILQSMKAYEPAISLSADQKIYQLEPVPTALLKFWLYTSCRVRGKVVKPVVSGSVTTDMPICQARVHICEVDPIDLVIPRLPDSIITRIRDELNNIIFKPSFPFPPEPEPFFDFDPRVINPSPVALAEMNRSALIDKNLLQNKNPKITRDFSVVESGKFANNLNINAINASVPTSKSTVFSAPSLDSSNNLINKIMDSGVFASNLKPISISSAVPSVSFELQTALKLNSPVQLRETFLSNIDLIKNHLCFWPWLLPYFYRCDELAVVQTNEQGVFDTTIYYLDWLDKPDLYFRVEYSIGGVWESVYRPPVHCYTYWDYVCGTEVTIRVSDPRVPWCGSLPTLPGRQIAIVSVGENISIKDIQTDTAGASEGLVSSGVPFGGSLEPRIFFGEELVGNTPGTLSSSGISYYRWSYRRLSSGASWQALEKDIVRHFSQVNPDSSLSFPTFKLGGHNVASQNFLYKIQAKNPSSGLWTPIISARENTSSGFFQSHLLSGGNAAVGAGKYELKLELFDNLGDVVNLTTAGVDLKIPNMSAPFAASTVTTIDAPDYNRIKNASGQTVAFRMVLHVDNNPTYAYMYDANVSGADAGDCGFIHYEPGQNVNLSFIARHPNNFASYDFVVAKGSSGGVPEAISSGRVGIDGTAAHNFYTLNVSGVYGKNIDAQIMVNCCATTCSKAAFAESLYVTAWATDGWSSRLSYLDSSGGLKAFALTNEPV